MTVGTQLGQKKNYYNNSNKNNNNINNDSNNNNTNCNSNNNNRMFGHRVSSERGLPPNLLGYKFAMYKN